MFAPRQVPPGSALPEGGARHQQGAPQASGSSGQVEEGSGRRPGFAGAQGEGSRRIGAFRCARGLGIREGTPRISSRLQRPSSPGCQAGGCRWCLTAAGSGPTAAFSRRFLGVNLGLMGSAHPHRAVIWKKEKRYCVRSTEVQLRRQAAWAEWLLVWKKPFLLFYGPATRVSGLERMVENMLFFTFGYLRCGRRDHQFIVQTTVHGSNHTRQQRRVAVREPQW